MSSPWLRHLNALQCISSPIVPCVQTLETQGLQAVPSYSTRGLHPFAIPLAEGEFQAWGNRQTGVVCVLRWPQPGKYPNMEMPVAVMTRGARGMQLVARSAREYIARALAEEDRTTGAPCVTRERAVLNGCAACHARRA